MLNLITNAVDAMSDVEERPRVLLLESELGEGNQVLVKVGDTGRGIDPNNLEQVFERFFTTKAHGMGMGLAICRSIVEAHHGQLWVEAGVEQGSTFRILLPIESTPMTAERQAVG